MVRIDFQHQLPLIDRLGKVLLFQIGVAQGVVESRIRGFFVDTALQEVDLLREVLHLSVVPCDGLVGFHQGVAVDFRIQLDGLLHLGDVTVEISQPEFHLAEIVVIQGSVLLIDLLFERLIELVCVLMAPGVEEDVGVGKSEFRSVNARVDRAPEMIDATSPGGAVIVVGIAGHGLDQEELVEHLPGFCLEIFPFLDLPQIIAHVEIGHPQLVMDNGLLLPQIQGAVVFIGSPAVFELGQENVGQLVVVGR